jgi:CubicO group peptidase (beta-lactamase class C family)
MTTVSITTKAGPIEGLCDPRFRGVLDAFVDNFETRDEVGASVAIALDGKPLVDLWGGRKTRDGEPWTVDTISLVFSSTKGATALCAHMLADRGLLDLDLPVGRYWPEFAQGGKENARVSMMLDHSVGVPHVRCELKDGGLYDYAYMVDLVAREPAFWEPGTRNGYHAMTMAWTVGEIVHRISRRRLGDFFANEVAKPLGLEFWIGLPEGEEHRVAPMIQARPDAAATQSKFMQTVQTRPGSPAQLFLRDLVRFNSNTREWRAAEIGSANGMTNARGLMGLYHPLANGGSHQGLRFVGKDTLERMSRVSMATHEDATLMIPTRFSLGYMKAMDNRREKDAGNASLLISEPAFGHVGAGGSVGFADPECRLSFGYTMNRMGLGLLMNERGQALIDAAYRALGYRSNAGGAWAY